MQIIDQNTGHKTQDQLFKTKTTDSNCDTDKLVSDFQLAFALFCGGGGEPSGDTECRGSFDMVFRLVPRELLKKLISIVGHLKKIDSCNEIINLC